MHRHTCQRANEADILPSHRGENLSYRITIGADRDSVGKVRRGRVLSTAPSTSSSCLGVAMASTLRKLKSLVLSQTTDIDRITNLLETVAVPLHTGDCRSCADPCTEGNSVPTFPSPPLGFRYYVEIYSLIPFFFFWDVGHEDWKFDRDMETQMVGTVKPYIRQVREPLTGHIIRERTDPKIFLRS